jgi:tetratricopeptide (TPR) repeat protein
MTILLAFIFWQDDRHPPIHETALTAVPSFANNPSIPAGGETCPAFAPASWLNYPMGFPRSLLRGVQFWALTLLICVFAGCASPKPDAAFYEGQSGRILFPTATLNGQPAHFILDTGSGVTMLSEQAASHFGLKSSALPPGYTVQTWNAKEALLLSNPTRLTFASDEFFTPLPIQTGEKPDSEKIDGVVGWPELSDDLLLFDGPKRTVSAIAAVPPDAAAWLKLKVRPGSLLILEMPLPNGDPNWIYVDTGSPFGVGFGPAHWSDWWKTNPQTPVFAGLIGSTHGAETWADHLSIGNLTLTQVPVFEENAPGLWSKDDEPAAILGLGALARMTMIVDRSNNLAYLQPAPRDHAPPAGKLVAAGNWTVAANVRLTMGPLRIFSTGGQAMAAFLDSDYPAAIAGFTSLIDHESDNPDAYCYRGYARLAQNDLLGALADFNQTIALDPSNAEAYHRRAATEQIEGDFSHALADYNKAIALKPDDSYRSRLLRQLLLLRLGLPTGEFSQTIAGWKDDWRKALGRFVTGTLEQSDFLAQITKSGDPSGQQLEAYYFAGAMRLLHGDPVEARAFWERCLATKATVSLEYHPLAKAELARLGEISRK